MDQDSPAAFFRRLIGRATAPASQDPADLGTAFGLEASLGPVSTYFVNDDLPAGQDRAAGEPPMHWLARRFRRSR
ncbi:MAG TPA: hypothetical protein PL196_08760 [Burkholderiaceae bacterium]|nr:hypothetical protein [Burkholderiaceae bacterium]